jgi:hypothetical protein
LGTKREQCKEGKNETLLSGASIRIVWVQFSLSEKTDKQEALQQQQHNAFQTKKNHSLMNLLEIIFSQ